MSTGSETDEELVRWWQDLIGTPEGQLIREFQMRFYKAFGALTVRTYWKEASHAGLSFAAALVALQDDGNSKMTAEEFGALAVKIFRSCCAASTTGALKVTFSELPPEAREAILESVKTCS